MLKYFYKEILGDLKMDTEQKPNFYQRHKKELNIIGISVLCMLGVGATIYLNKNADSENEEESISFTDNKDESSIVESDYSISSDDSPVQKFESKSKSICVPGHIRRLPEGQNPSPKKLAEAEDHGISLSHGETIVDPYKRKSA